MTVDEREAMRTQLEQALAIADQHGLVLTAAWITKALEALSSETAIQQR